MPFTTHQIQSPDGTILGYRQKGEGPGLIICHGGGRISQNYEKLALALADTFTVYIPDRRGRGLSGPEGEDYKLLKASEDLQAIILHTGAEYIFGHSAGGLVAVEALLRQPVKKLALYEPAISVNQSLPTAWLANFEGALNKGRRKKAMAIMLKGLGAVEGMEKMPLWLILLLVNFISLLDGKKEKGTRMLNLLPTLSADIKMVRERDSDLQQYSALHMPVRILTGSKSPYYFHQGANALVGILPRAHGQVLEGLDHYSPEEKVDEIAIILKDFFLNG